MDTPAGITLRFHPRDDQAYGLRLSGPEVGEARGDFAPLYDPATWQAIARALEPGFDSSPLLGMATAPRPIPAICRRRWAR